jgi:PilZ domain.
MTSSEQRKFERAGALNLLTYSCVNEQNGINTQQGLGRTLNVSEGGVLLETYIHLNLKNTISLTIALKEKMVDIKGKILWCKENAEGMFVSGIEFYEMELDAFAILKRYLELFYKEPPQ